ncbi:MAG TPA: hypothetical protein VJ844_14290 [Mucilaginibacter sp.]|nr:hypothetical protein [Mucilaginibacter sp.]
MWKLSNIGRIFYGIATAGMGLQAIFLRNSPYFLLPPVYPGKTVMVVISLAIGILFAWTGECIVFKQKARRASLLLGGFLLLVFCYFVTYELLLSHNYASPGEWENAEKGLALAGGAFTVAGCFSQEDKNPLTRFLARLIPAGTIIFAITIICFGMLHFVYAKQAASYIPAWIPGHLFWMYFCGAALLGSGIAIIFRIRVRLIAMLLGAMILTWFIILHIPKVITAASADRADEITSAFLALAYSGIAFVISGTSKKAA